MLSFIFLAVGILTQQTFAEEPEAIVGGEPANPGEFPHQVSLRYQGSHVCGGSIINNTKILTAAHCVDFISSISQLKIATGSTSITGGQLHNVGRIVIHPLYGGKAENAWVNDIAVITLQSPIQYNQYQSPIILTTSEPAAGQQCTLSGWGRTSVNGPAAKSLLKMNQAVVSRTECQQAHRGMPLTSSHLCTLNRLGIGACSGDSGGPLISNGVQVGITSWVTLCARGVPDVYTNIYPHLNFIRSS